MKYAPFSAEQPLRNGRLDVYDMTDKELKRLSRIELLNMLVESGRAKEALEEELQELRRELSARQEQSADEREQMAAAQRQLLRARQEMDAQQQKTAEVQKELRSARQQLESARSQLTAAQQTLGDERAQAAAWQQEIEAKNNQLCAAGEQIECLGGEVNELRAQLADRTIIKENAGTLADAAAQINGVFAAAQNTAAQYLENIERMKREQEAECRRLEAQAQAQAQRLIDEAQARCEEMERQTRRKCEELQYIAEEKARIKWNSLSKQLDQISLEIRNSMGAPNSAERELFEDQ